MGLGVTTNQEVGVKYRVRDMRSSTERVSDWLKEPANAAVTMVVLGGVALLLPPLTEAVAAIGCGIFLLFGPKQAIEAKIRVPITVDALDKSYERSKPSEGVFYIGNEADKVGRDKVPGSKQEEIWLDNPDSRAHVFVFGTTGSGKTELLLSFVYCALCWGSGAVYVDGKGTPKLYCQVYALMRTLGREDDARLMNFMIGKFDARKKRPQRISNRMNFLASGSGSFLTELVVSLMPESGGDGATWKDRAINMASGVVNSLTCLRDRGDILLHAGVLRDHLTLGKIVEMAEDKQNKYRLPDNAKNALRSYLGALPGYNPAKKPDEQAQTCRDQHGYLQMQFTKTLGDLSDVYGHIFFCDISEVHMEDVVLQNRVLVVLIPSLEKSDHQNRALGNIAVASARAMMASTMGAEVHGDYEHIIETLPTNSPVPFPSVWDEIGQFLPKAGGTAVMPAQARSLGQQMIFAGQDMPAVVKAGKEEAAAMLGNTTTQILLKCTEHETLQLMQQRAGEATVAVAESSERSTGGLTRNYIDRGGARNEKAQRLTVDETASYVSGQGVLMFNDKVIRFRGMYSDVKPRTVRVNCLLQVRPPEIKDLENMGERKRVRDATLLALQLFFLARAAEPPPDATYLPLSGYAKVIGKLHYGGSARGRLPHELAAAAWIKGMAEPVAAGELPTMTTPTNTTAISDRLENDFELGEVDEEYDGTMVVAQELDRAENIALVNNIVPIVRADLIDDLATIGTQMGVDKAAAQAEAEIVANEVDASASYPPPALDIAKMQALSEEGNATALFDQFFLDDDETDKGAEET